MNVEIISDVLESNAISFIRAFRFLRKQEFFLKFDEEKYYFWFDCGTHFKCQESMHFCLKELVADGKNIQVNFFENKHGKNCRDARFSIVSKYIEYYSFKKAIMTTADIMEAIISGQNQSNNRRIVMGKEPILFKVLEFGIENSKTITQRYFKLENISKLYNLEAFKNENNELTYQTRILTHSDVTYPLIEKDSKEEDSFVIVQSFDNPFNPRIFSQEDFFKRMNWVSRKLRQDTEEEEEAEDQEIPAEQQLMAPNYCRISTCGHCDMSKKCKVRCSYNADEVNDSIICTSEEVKQELSHHGHPKSRLMKKDKYRTSIQARNELLEHYNHFH